MFNTLIPSHPIASIKIRKINHLNNIFSPSNSPSSDFTNLIYSNQRFNIKETTKKNFLKNDKNSANKKLEIRKIKLNSKNNIKYRSKSVLHLPNISKTSKISKKNKFIITQKNFIKNNKIAENFFLKKLENKNNKRELLINPVSLDLSSSSRIKTNIIKRKTINKDAFIQRVKNYKKRLKEELSIYSRHNFSNLNSSENRTQNYIIDKDNNFNCNNFSNIYYANNSKQNVNNELSFVYNKIMHSKSIYNDSRKFQFNDETKNNKYFY